MAIAVLAAVTLALLTGGGPATATGRLTRSLRPATSVCVGVCVHVTFTGSGKWDYEYQNSNSKDSLTGSQKWNEQYAFQVQRSGSKGNYTYSLLYDGVPTKISQSGSSKELESQSGSTVINCTQPLTSNPPFNAAMQSVGSTGPSSTSTFKLLAYQADMATTSCGETGAGQALYQNQNPTGAIQGPFASVFSVNASTWLAPGAHSETIPVSYSYTSHPGGANATYTISWKGTITLTEGQCAVASATGVAHAAGAAAVSMYLNGKKLRSGATIKTDGARWKVKGGTVEDVVAGQKLNLSVECDGEHPGTATWKVQGATGKLRTTSAVALYDVTNAGDKSSALWAPLASQPKGYTLRLYFIHPGKHAYRVTATVPGKGSVTRTFRVSTPKVLHDLPKSTCVVNFTEEALRGVNIGDSWVGPGYNVTCPGGPAQKLGEGSPGMEWAFPVHADSSQAGKLAMIQLISIDMRHNGQRCKAQSTSKAADMSAFWDSTNPEKQKRKRAYIKLGAASTSTWRDRDSPHLALDDRTGHWYESFAAHDWLMYKPKQPSSSWIALGDMSWSWQVKVSRANRSQGWHGKLEKQLAFKRLKASRVTPPLFTRGFSPPQDPIHVLLSKLQGC